MITVWNKAAETMKRYTAEEAIGRNLAILYSDEDRAAGRPESKLEDAIRTGFFYEEQWRKRKDGSLFWARVTLTALRADDEHLLGFSKVTIDLTSHKLLETCTAEKEEIDLILRAAESGTWKWDIERDQIKISSHLMQLLGHAAGDATLGFEPMLAFVHADDREHFRTRLEGVRRGETSALSRPNCACSARKTHSSAFLCAQPGI